MSDSEICQSAPPSFSAKLATQATQLLALVAVIGACLYSINNTIFQSQATGALSPQLAGMQESGEPLSSSGLHNYYCIPMHEPNVTPQYLAAFHSVSENSTAKALQQLHEAADAVGYARYPVEFAIALYGEQSHYAGLRESSKLLQEDAAARLRAGEYAAATKSVRALIKLTETLRIEPCQSSQLLRFELWNDVRNVTLELIQDPKFPGESLDTLRAEIETQSLALGLANAQMGQRALYFEELSSPTSEFGRRHGGSAVSSEDAELLLKLLTVQLEGTRHPFPFVVFQMRATPDQIRERLAALPEQLPWQREVILQQVLPAYEELLENGMRAECQRRALFLICGVERFRREHGKLPETLVEMIPGSLPAVPSDPCSGRDLYYQISAESYLIYSVGVDQQDDDGDAVKDFGIQIALTKPAGQ